MSAGGVGATRKLSDKEWMVLVEAADILEWMGHHQESMAVLRIVEDES